MSSRNSGFVADLAGALEPVVTPVVEEAPRPSRLGIGALTGRANRLAELASGTVISRAQELVDPSRCRMWAEHNRDYGLLTEQRCADLIESLKAQGRQEVGAVVRRVRDDPDFDFEVICGARRHWSVSWLRRNNYPEFRFLVEARELTDEEAFRISDLENRAREDLTDLERAKDYLGALERHYGGRQKAMAQRLNVSESWLSRYLDLARLPAELKAAFPDPQALGIKHVTQLKPLMKPDERRSRVLAEAKRLSLGRGAGDEQPPQSVQTVIRALVAAADAPKKSGSPKKAGKANAEVISSSSGQPVFRIETIGKKEIGVTLFPQAGGTRADAEQAFSDLLTRYWRQTPDPSGGRSPPPRKAFRPAETAKE
jgi:ParB family chromosome partitioning protein